MSKRIVYQRRVYERVAVGPSSFDARVRSLSADVLRLAQDMRLESDTPRSIPDNVMEILNSIKNELIRKPR